MKKVLCFGDSNVFGYIPETGARYDKDTRWSGVLKSLCQTDFSIIEAGCNNRTGFTDNPCGRGQTGYKIITNYLEKELFAVVLAIGINDLQKSYNQSLDNIKMGLENLVHTVKEASPNAHILILVPTKLSETIFNGGFSILFDETSILKSCELSSIYKAVATNEGCKFIDLNEVAQYSLTDGLHYTPKEHKKIADAVKNVLLSL